MNQPGTSAVDIHPYGRQLQAEKQVRGGDEVFELNAKRFPDHGR